MLSKRPIFYSTVVFLLLALVVCYLVYKGWGSAWWMVLVAILYLSLLIIGATKIQWNFYIKSIHKGNDNRQVALSFDDGPATHTATILTILKEHQVPAAFFCIGERASKHPEIVKQWDEEGHLIGNHSYHHGFNFDWQSTAKMQEEISRANKYIATIIGKTPTFFRPPYGVTNPNLSQAILNTHMHSIGWSIRSYDTTAKNEQQLLARILKQVTGGDIILLHDSMEITAKILPHLITQLRNKGFSFARLDTLIALPAYE